MIDALIESTLDHVARPSPFGVDRPVLGPRGHTHVGDLEVTLRAPYEPADVEPEDPDDPGCSAPRPQFCVNVATGHEVQA